MPWRDLPPDKTAMPLLLARLNRFLANVLERSTTGATLAGLLQLVRDRADKLILKTPGVTAAAHIGQDQNSLLLAINAYFDTLQNAWLRDDVTRAAWVLMLHLANDRLELRRAAAGANPIVWTNVVLQSAASLTTIADLNAAGGHRHTVDGWYMDNVAAGLTNVPCSRSPQLAFPTQWNALRAGSIMGVIVKSNTARTAGSLTATVYVNGVNTGLTAVLDGTNTTVKVTLAAKDAWAFNAGDALSIRITTTGDWTPTTADISCGLDLET